MLSTIDGPSATPAPTSETFRLLDGLSRASVTRRWEAYRDVDWDAAGHEIDADDPIWDATGSWDPLATCPWYRDQAPAKRAAIGLRRLVELLTTGVAAERVLGEGLIRYAATLPNGHPAFRYAYHEVAEEAQHSLMFHEVIDRSGLTPAGPPADVRRRLDRFAAYGDTLPVLFLVAALATEAAFDHVQRQVLAMPHMHPLVRRVFRIHVAEEARHLCFARAVLRDVVPRFVPRLSHRGLRELRLQVPFIIKWTVTHMVGHSESFLNVCDAPAEARRHIIEGPLARDMRRKAAVHVSALCRDLGIVDHRLNAVALRRPVSLTSGPERNQQW